VSDKKRTDYPEDGVPEDAVSPGALSPKPARWRPGHAAPKEADRDAPSSARASDHIQPAPAKRRPNWGLRIIGFLVAAGLGAAGVLAYQQWGPKPVRETAQACLDRTLPDLIDTESRQLQVILAPLFNDVENSQRARISAALEDFQGTDEPLMQLQMLDCSIAPDGAGMLQQLAKTRALSRDILRTTGADVLVWGEVSPDAQRLDLLTTYPVGADRGLFDIDQISLPADFDADHAALLAAKVWLSSDVTAKLDTELIAAGMQNTVDRLSPLTENAAASWSEQQQGTLYHSVAGAGFLLGLQANDPQRMESALDNFRTASETFGRYNLSDDWVRVQNEMGVARSTFGKLTNRFQEIGLAIDAFKAAISETPRSRYPEKWSMIQSNLAEALNALGARESDSQLLADSVTAYREVLKEQSPERFPQQWSAVQHNLGAALQSLGQKDNDPAILKASTVAYQAALEVRTAEDQPKAHAVTQINLGATLMALGTRLRSVETLREAAAAFNAAISQLERDTSPVEWGTAQHSLGNALVAIGEQEEGTESLKLALIAFRSALDEFDRAKDPTRWAVTQNNLGNVLHMLGDREQDAAVLAEAVVAYEAALGVLSESAPAYAESVVQSLARVQALQQSLNQAE
tara:strand:- start:18501 stop:20399 length:1899 start_codon:yes stop_codon:yes gene_type:complete